MEHVALHQLVDGLSDDLGQLPVLSLAVDSREVQPNGVFLAVQGVASHGLDYIDVALNQGVAVVLWQAHTPWVASAVSHLSADVVFIEVDNLASKVSDMGARFYFQKGLPLSLIGFTGTNGKSSCTHFLAQAFADDYPCAVVGTLGNGFLHDLQAASHTTPDALSVHALLADFFRLGAKAVAMEVSSHALDQGRVSAVAFDTAVLTNVTRDHLDYHQTLEHYANAKAKLFQSACLKRIILNIDDDFSKRLIRDANDCRVLGYAIDAPLSQLTGLDAWVKVTQLQPLAHKTRVVIQSSWGDGVFETRLLGRFNISNLLSVLLVLVEYGFELADACQRLSRATCVSGRMEVFREPNKPQVVVDFAHTPDALEKALVALGDMVMGKLICVFGCGGDRDQGKRALMGQVAQATADVIYLTNDNPRSENPDDIVEQILSGMDESTPVYRELDRKKAIEQAIAQASRDDWILVAGKGHEQTQIMGSDRISFSDQVVVQDALARWCA